mmetsp:Transcript_96784/g.295870  ORF Transcript_96784/g.295870 Transcript_96784/m.295870 type:complete len:226 (+) Transcript_96784:888-1565(+)
MPADRERHERGQQHQEEVDDVEEARLQRADDHAQVRLRLERCEEGQHQDQVVLRHQYAEPTVEGRRAQAAVKQPRPRGVHVRRHVVALRVDDLPEVVDHGAAQTVLHQVAADDHVPEQQDQPIEHRVVRGARPPPGAAPRGPPGPRGGEGEEAQERQGVGALAREAVPRDEEERLHGDPGEDAAAAAEGEHNRELLKPRPAHLGIQKKGPDRQLLGLGVEPAAAE